MIPRQRTKGTNVTVFSSDVGGITQKMTQIGRRLRAETEIGRKELGSKADERVRND